MSFFESAAPKKVQILPDDIMSFFASAALNSPSMAVAIICMLLQLTTIIFVFLDSVQKGLNIPPNVPTPVRAVQFLCLIITVVSQSDVCWLMNTKDTAGHASEFTRKL
jgi:hypothetical protein